MVVIAVLTADSSRRTLLRYKRTVLVLKALIIRNVKDTTI